MKRPELTEELRLKKEDQDRKRAVGEFIAEQDLIRDPEPYEERTVKVEEFLLSLIDYQDLLKAKTERWRL